MEDIRVPPPVVPAVALLLGWLADWTLPLPELPPDVWPVGAFLVVLGVALAGWAFLVQFRAGTDPDVRKPTTALVVTGPYGFSRNPVYVAFLLLQAGVGLWTGWWVAAALVPFSGLALSVYVIRREEAFLSTRFADYDAYRDRVRRWF